MIAAVARCRQPPTSASTVATARSSHFWGPTALERRRPCACCPRSCVPVPERREWLVVMWRRWRNLRPPKPDSTQPVRVTVEAEVRRLRFLERFWGDVSWGTIALVFVGEVLAFEGFRPVDAERTIVTFVFYLLLLGAIAVIVFRNPVVARKKVRPLREDLESWLEGLKALEHNDAPQLGTEGSMT